MSIPKRAASLLAHLVGAALLGVTSMTSFAEDIDAFTSFAPQTGVRPNVLFIIDNTANWSQTANGTNKYTAEKAGLTNVFNSLPTTSGGAALYNIGVLLGTENGNPDSNSDGGYVRAAIRPMDSTTRTKYGSMINTLDIDNDKGANGFAGLLMTEAYRYLSGSATFGGAGKVKADYTGNTAANWKPNTFTAAEKTAMQAVYALSGNALGSASSTTYIAPPAPTGDLANCTARTYIIYISNGPAQDNNSATTAATSALSAAGGDTTTIPVSPTGSQSNMADEWARYLHLVSPLQVTTYTVDVIPGTTGQGPGWTALLKSMASVSHGKYVAINSISDGGTEISTAINKILAEIQDINSTFAPVSLPASVNSQGSYLNQIYIGMFRPDADAFPRWNGNLKQYKLGLVGTDLRLQDADGSPAINSTSGFITPCARSYWTPTTADTYWSFDPQGGCPPPQGQASTYYKNSNFPDGSVVEKGAAGYLLRQVTPSTRPLSTCQALPASCSLSDFKTTNSNITATLLGAATSTARDNYINWMRGQDLLDENSNGNTTEARPSIHGDVVHSQPYAVNFGTDASPKIVVFYGDNGGVLHAINGNRTAAIGSSAAGKEMWGFVPPESYGNIKRLYDNTVQVSYPNVVGGSPKPYGMDGPVTGLKVGSDQYIYSIMRRGGRMLYAFRGSVDSGGSLEMSIAWRVGCPNLANDTSCSGSMSGIGQTWAKPVPATVAANSNPVLFVSGGYDSCEDSDPHSCTSSSKGNKIYVLSAVDGTLLKTFDTLRPVIANVTVVNNNSGVAQYAYAADQGGNVYRIDVRSNNTASWSNTQIASLGCDTTASCSNNRKFQFGPDVVVQNGVYYLMIGSGDREKPTTATTNSYGTTNYFFMIEDKPEDTAWLSSQSGACSSNMVCLNALLPISVGDTVNSTALAAKSGWYLRLASHEFVATSAITLFGTVYFSSYIPYVPAANSCGTGLGTTTAYQINFMGSGSVKTPINAPVGLPPSPSAGLVKLDDGTTKPFCIGCSPIAPLEAISPEPPPSSTTVRPKSRTYWVIKQ